MGQPLHSDFLQLARISSCDARDWTQGHDNYRQQHSTVFHRACLQTASGEAAMRADQSLIAPSLADNEEPTGPTADCGTQTQL